MTDQTQGAAQTTTDAASGNQSAGAATNTQGATLATGAGNPAVQQQQDGGQQAAPDGKQVDQAGDGKDGQAPATETVPEAYEFKLPDGMDLDQKAFDAFAPQFKELGLTQEKAQKLVDVYAEMRQNEIQAETESYAQQVEQWGKDVQTDKEIGGAAFNSNVLAAQKAVAAFATPELKALLDSTGYGNHPEFVRFCVRIGKQLSEDGFVSANGNGSADVPLHQRMYPTKQP